MDAREAGRVRGMQRGRMHEHVRRRAPAQRRPMLGDVQIRASRCRYDVRHVAAAGCSRAFSDARIAFQLRRMRRSGARHMRMQRAVSGRIPGIAVTMKLENGANCRMRRNPHG